LRGLFFIEHIEGTINMIIPRDIKIPSKNVTSPANIVINPIKVVVENAVKEATREISNTNFYIICNRCNNKYWPSKTSDLKTCSNCKKQVIRVAGVKRPVKKKVKKEIQVTIPPPDIMAKKVSVPSQVKTPNTISASSIRIKL
jgi:hypothetical protein